MAAVLQAQPPQLIPYQAIARDNVGNPVLNQNIGLRFSIHDQTISGALVWQESQTVVSNNLGIIVTALGGTVQLTSVDWGSGGKFLQVEMDITGGSNYLDMGTQQMMSVPYALYAETAGSSNISNSVTNLPPGTAVGNTMYWDGTQWVVNNQNIFNAGQNVGIGDSTPAEKLSEDRARAVSAYLLKKGIATERIDVKFYGETKPIASNDTDEGRRMNRRVEMKFVFK